MQIPPAAKAGLLRAAAVANATFKAFMLHNALRAADDGLEQAGRSVRSECCTQIILDLLDNPPEPKSCLAGVLSPHDSLARASYP
ncbi:MAG: DUF1778 domain-containing protein [Thermomicrobiales bacterium]|nr:DUF1778 domain-containing protein [Thermomicrobiales bacterium]